MRYAIVADVHGNLPALEAVLRAISDHRHDQLLCLGDVVGYGADPGACLDRLDAEGALHLQGNHEARLLELPTPRFSSAAEQAIGYSRSILTADQLRRFGEFPEQQLVGEDILCVHGSPDDRDEYLRHVERIREVLAHLERWICLCGHTHLQFVFGDQLGESEPGRYDLDRNSRYLINPGSVGQPRDGDRRAAWALLDTDEAWVELFRAEYDIDKAATAILEAGLPDSLAKRLSIGR